MELIRSTGAVASPSTLSLITELDPLGEAIDDGLGLLAGPRPRCRRRPARRRPPRRWRSEYVALGRSASPTALAEQVVVTPACGLAGASGEYARTVLAACRDAGGDSSRSAVFVVPGA